MGSGFCKVRSLKEPVEQNSVTIYGILERNQFVTVYFDFALISRFQLLGEKIILRKLPSHCTYDSLRHSFFECPSYHTLSTKSCNLWLRRAGSLVTWLELESVVFLSWSAGYPIPICKTSPNHQWCVFNLLKLARSGQMLSLSAQSLFRPALVSRSVENINF